MTESEAISMFAHGTVPQAVRLNFTIPVQVETFFFPRAADADGATCTRDTSETCAMTGQLQGLDSQHLTSGNRPIEIDYGRHTHTYIYMNINLNIFIYIYIYIFAH